MVFSFLFGARRFSLIAEDDKNLKIIGEKFEANIEHIKDYLIKFDSSDNIDSKKRIVKSLQNNIIDAEKNLNNFSLEYNMTPSYIKKKYKYIVSIYQFYKFSCRIIIRFSISLKRM